MRSLFILFLAAGGLAVAVPAPAPFPNGPSGTGNSPDCGQSQAACCDGDSEEGGTLIGGCITCLLPNNPSH